MTVTITGMDLSIGSCSTLAHFKRTIYSGKDSIGDGIVNPSQVALKALDDGKLKDYNNLLFISSPHPDLLDLPNKLELESSQYKTLLPELGSDLSPLAQADRVIQEDPRRKVLLTISSASGTISLLLTHPEMNHTGYADLEQILVSDGKKSGDTWKAIKKISYFHLCQNKNEIDQETFRKLHDLVSPATDSQIIALGGLDPDISGMNKLLHITYSALLIHLKSIPASPLLPGNHLDFPKDSPFYLADEYRPWLDRGQGFSRSALVFNLENRTNPGIHWLLNETTRTRTHHTVRSSIMGSEPYLVLIPGDTIADIDGQLQELETFLDDGIPLETISGDAYTKFSKGIYRFVCCLVSSNSSELAKEISFAKIGIFEAEKTNSSWTSPKGSYFTANPLGESGLAFIYPGAFNSYPGMGQHLFDYFPTLHDSAKEIIPNCSHSLSEKHIYPSTHPQTSGTTQNDRLMDLYNHPIELIESGISFSVLHTLILKDIFHIQPQVSFGYSLGEASMLWANRVWQNAAQSSQAWSDSAIFKNQLYGEMTTLREYWKDQELGPDFWGSYILKAPLESVQSSLQKESQVFLTIINTPNEVVIAGLNEACQRVISDLDCHALPMPFNASIHNPGVDARYSDFVDIYTNETLDQPGMQYYSASIYGPLELTSESLGQSMAKMTCNPVDFPKLVQEVYKDGIKIFIEVGPQKTCSRWIERILESSPHAVIPVNKKHQSDYIGILKVLSLLVSHKVPLDLSPLFTDPENGSSDLGHNDYYAIQQAEQPAQILSTQTDRSADILPETRTLDQSEATELDLQYLNHISRLSSDISKTQEQFLDNQAAITENIKRILTLKGSYPIEDNYTIDSQEAMYTEDQIIAFTIGDHRDCFGDLFSNFEDRRIPRLPNGPLRFIDRVLDIKASEGDIVIGSSLYSEVDIPVQDWYLADNDQTLPHVSLLEIALQPCGFLSAYMGSIKDRSNADLYFRNLDGEGTLLSWPDLSGSTIGNRVELISSSTLQDVIIQEYSFELFYYGEPFYKGKSSFGYFTQAMLNNQSGLDGNVSTEPWKDKHPESGQMIDFVGDRSLQVEPTDPTLPDINQVWISKNGGDYNSGYIQAQIEVPINAWFYKAHFYQDPVMPGSLGVEAMAQALIRSSSTWGLASGSTWRIKPGSKTTWKYRGQITPGIESIIIDLHIKEIKGEKNGGQITADGNLWLGNTRIYHVEDITLESH